MNCDQKGNEKPSVLLVSVDALKPEFVFEQERLGVNLPNITKYFKEGGMAAKEGMKSVFPTFTYPCHQSMIRKSILKKKGLRIRWQMPPILHGLRADAWYLRKQEKNI